ncbi:MAG: M20 family metallopeptidase [Nitrospinota bacterium]
MQNRLKESVIKEVDRLKTDLIDICMTIHSNPEVKFKEFKAVEVLTTFLEKNDFEVTKGTGGLETAFNAVFKGPGNGPAIAFLAEYDALPQIGHACGHNIVGSAGVGAAVALKKAAADSIGKIIVVGTPAEEGGGGKIILIEKGIFEDIDIAMMIHPSNKTRMVRLMLAVAETGFIFHGRAAHAAAYPHKGINALDGVILTFNNINALRQQLKNDVRIHGIITEGGYAPNIIPEMASAQFYVRALEEKYFKEVVEKVKECARGAAIATGTKLDIKTERLIYRPFKPNYTLAEIFRDNLSLIGIREDPGDEKGDMGSSDIGNVSQTIPTIHADISICDDDVVCHSPGFRDAAISEKGIKGIVTGAKALALTALDIFISPEKMDMIRKEFEGK